MASGHPGPSLGPDTRPDARRLPRWCVARSFPINAARTTPVRPSQPLPRNCRSTSPPSSPRVRHRASSAWASDPLRYPTETALRRNDGNSSRHAAPSLRPRGLAAPWGDSLESLPPAGTSDNRHCIRGSRFFLTQMFFQRFRTGLEHDVADLELGLSEDLLIRLADQEPSNLQKLLLRQFPNPLRQRLRFGFLFNR